MLFLRALSLTLVFLPLALHADLQLTFQVTQKTVTPGRDPAKDKPTTSTREFPLVVTLGSDYFSQIEDKKLAIFDFADRKIHHIDQEQKTADTTSLYAHIGFSEAEFQNRLKLQKVMGAGGIKENPFDTVLMEHLFSLRSPDTKPLSPKKSSGSFAFVHGRKPLFSCATKGTALSKDDTQRFIRFLRNAYGIHPDILAALEKLRVVPATFDLHRYNMREDHFHVVLTKSGEVAGTFDRAQVLAGLKPVATEIDDVCSLAQAISPEQFQVKCDQLVAAAIRESQTGHYLDSMLLFLESTLSSGQPLPPLFQSYRKAIQDDPDCTRFFGAMKPQSRAEAEKAVEVIRSLHAKTKHGLVILKIHEANHLTALGKPRESLQLFHEVLRESPHIVGAWKDFGDLYYNSYEAGLAWKCWDTGRRLLPTQPQLKPVNEFEARLVSEHPEFF